MSNNQENNFIKSAIYEAIEISLEAQLRAIRRLRQPEKEITKDEKSMTHIDMAFDILKRASKPLHISEILSKIEIIHQTKVDKESLVSAITKKIKRGDRFIKTDKNTFTFRKNGE